MEPQGRDKMKIVQVISGLAQDLGNVKKLTDEERRTLKVALSSLEDADKNDLTRIETAMKLSRQYTPSSKLGSLIKGIRNILPSWLGGRVSSKSLRALINKKAPPRASIFGSPGSNVPPNCSDPNGPGDSIENHRKPTDESGDNIDPAPASGATTSKVETEQEAIFNEILDKVVLDNLVFDFGEFADNLKKGDTEAWDQFLKKTPGSWSENPPNTPTRDRVLYLATNAKSVLLKGIFTKQVKETLRIIEPSQSPETAAPASGATTSKVETGQEAIFNKILDDVASLISWEDASPETIQKFVTDLKNGNEDVWNTLLAVLPSKWASNRDRLTRDDVLNKAKLSKEKEDTSPDDLNSFKKDLSLAMTSSAITCEQSEIGPSNAPSVDDTDSSYDDSSDYSYDDSSDYSDDEF